MNAVFKQVNGLTDSRPALLDSGYSLQAHMSD